MFLSIGRCKSAHFLLFSFWILFWSATELHAASESKIRVLTLKNRASVKVSGFGLIISGNGIGFQTEILPRKMELLIVGENNGWTVGEVGRTETVQKFAGSKLNVTGEMIRINGIAAADDLLLVKERRKNFSVIAELGIEEYLKGVLPSEMPPKWPIEAIKAQAVAARTYALSIMRDRVKEPYHVDDTINHQVFSLQNYVGASRQVKDKIERALRETQGFYLVDSKGRPYRTYYHSDCGGVTEEPKEVWGFGSPNGTVKDSACALRAQSAWEVELTIGQVGESVKKLLHLTDNLHLKKMSVHSLTGSDRVKDLQLDFIHDGYAENEIAESRVLSAQEFRKIVGFDIVKSTMFALVQTADKVKISGRGHGHGAGMCQLGARIMAIGGANFRQILKRYYPHSMAPNDMRSVALSEETFSKTK